MKLYTKEEFEDEYQNEALKEIQRWTFEKKYRDTCCCISRWYGTEFRVYENCSNCLGKGFPPIALGELK